MIILIRCARDFCNEKEIMAIADTMVANGMRDLGYQYINLDGEMIQFVTSYVHIMQCILLWE